MILSIKAFHSFFFQITICCITAIVSPPEARMRMPIPTEPYLELMCHVDVTAFLAPLTYNVLVIIVASCYAFRTRKLPENFNESRYIFLSVFMTLFMWLAFLPTYFASFYAYHRAVLLSVALIINGVVTILCLFIPKLYALYYIDESKIKFGTMTSVPHGGIDPFHGQGSGVGNRVDPVV